MEADPNDRFWGIGMSDSDKDAVDCSKWRGLNWMGEILTDVRDELIRQGF